MRLRCVNKPVQRGDVMFSDATQTDRITLLVNRVQGGEHECFRELWEITQKNLKAWVWDFMRQQSGVDQAGLEQECWSLVRTRMYRCLSNNEVKNPVAFMSIVRKAFFRIICDDVKKIRKFISIDDLQGNIYEPVAPNGKNGIEIADIYNWIGKLLSADKENFDALEVQIVMLKLSDLVGEEWSQRQIADHFGVSENKVENTMAKFRRMYSTEIRKEIGLFKRK